MAAVRASSPDESFFNDLSQQPDADPSAGAARTGDNVAKPKRIACILCRKRKLKCDGQRPACGTCKRLAHECAYDEVRKKSGPKRGYVKALEARLQQVETLLKTQDAVEPAQVPQDATSLFSNLAGPSSTGNESSSGPATNMEPQTLLPDPSPKECPLMPNNGSMDTGSGSDPFSWEMIGLGLDEPLPQQDVINELTQIYFDKVHPFLPMIHRPRFYAAMNLAPHMRPPICLRYIMWCFAASQTDKYTALQEHFYYRARKYAQQDEMKGFGEQTLTLAHCQAWAIIASYEFRLMYFPRAWISCGRAVRLAQMMSLHKIDGTVLDVKQCLPPPRDWTDKEERRRTWWICFTVDRYASIGTGWPMTIDEQDIHTILPVSEEAFDKSRPMDSISLEDALHGNGAAQLSSTGGTIVMASLFGRNLTHLHRPKDNDNEHDINGEFWNRHRALDNLLLNLSLTLPDSLRVPSGLPDPRVVFMNMCIHTSAICLHQAAIFKAEKNILSSTISQECKMRCITAAAEITNIMRLSSHLDMATMSPFMAFCLYVAARVFVQYLKTRPDDLQVNSNLQFLVRAMSVLKRKNPLVHSFMIQLDLEMEGAGIMMGFQGRKHDKEAFDMKMHYQKLTEASNQPTDTTEPVKFPASCSQPRAFGDGGLAVHVSSTRDKSKASPGRQSFQANPRTQSSDLDSGQWPQSGSVKYGTSVNLPSRQRTPMSTSETQPTEGRLSWQCGYVSPEKDSADMDTSPDPNSNSSGQGQSPATSNSQQRSSSNASYSSGFPAAQQQQSFGGSVQNFQPTASNADGSGSGTAFFGLAADDDFGDLAAQFYNPTTGMSDWDLGGGGGTGLTPLPESTWNQMLDQPGWTGYGSGPH